MVRIKHRYLLINVLYPDGPASKLIYDPEETPDTVQFHQPSSPEWTDVVLRRLVQQNVSELFGDYGSGMVAGSLKGMSRQ